MFDPEHRQPSYRVRFDWGPTGAAAIAEGADVAVVVDVLSFTTTLCVAVERGMAVLPYRWKDERAAAYAEERAATLAVGRLEARSLPGEAGVSLSPAAMARVSGVDRVVLPSPNGSSIAFGLADSGCTVVGACLRNRRAVADWLAARDGTVAVVAAGERWPDGSLRPAVEDLWGAGAVLALLDDARPLPGSPAGRRRVPCGGADAAGCAARLRLRAASSQPPASPRTSTWPPVARRQRRRAGADMTGSSSTPVPSALFRIRQADADRASRVFHSSRGAGWLPGGVRPSIEPMSLPDPKQPDERRRSPGFDTEELEHLLTRVQDGVVSRRQLRELGARDHDIVRLVRRRDLVAVHPGVYVAHTGNTYVGAASLGGGAWLLAGSAQPSVRVCPTRPAQD